MKGGEDLEDRSEIDDFIDEQIKVIKISLGKMKI